MLRTTNSDADPACPPYGRDEMTMIDNAIADVAGRFGLGPKAGQLMQEVVRLITGSPGGVSGFIDKFRSAGLGSEVTSWLGRTDGAVLAGPQVERALGSTALGEIAGRLGLGSGAVATAIGYFLPKVIGQITPGGIIPIGHPGVALRLPTDDAGADNYSPRGASSAPRNQRHPRCPTSGTVAHPTACWPGCSRPLLVFTVRHSAGACSGDLDSGSGYLAACADTVDTGSPRAHQ